MRTNPPLRAALAVTGAALSSTPAHGWEPEIARRADWRPRVPLTVLVGDADHWTQPGPCRGLAERSRLAFIEYAGADHGLDARVARGLGGVKGGAAHVGTDAADRGDQRVDGRPLGRAG